MLGKMHTFQRDGTASFCFFCKNLWSGSSSTISTYYSCQICGLATHGACKSAFGLCIPCDPSCSPRTPSGPFNGSLQLRIKHAHEIGNRSGSQIYAMWKFGAYSARSENATAGQDECVWIGESGETPAAQSLSVELQQGDIEQAAVTLELWISYLGIFDSQIASTSFSILPLLWCPGRLVERWFDLADAGKGKVLLEILFQSAAPGTPHKKPPDGSWFTFGAADDSSNAEEESAMDQSAPEAASAVDEEDNSSFDVSMHSVIESTPFSAPGSEKVITSEPGSSPARSSLTPFSSNISTASTEDAMDILTEKNISNVAVAAWTEKTMSKLGNWLFELESEVVQGDAEPAAIIGDTTAIADLPISTQPVTINHPTATVAADGQSRDHAGVINLTIASAFLHADDAADGDYFLQISVDSVVMHTSHIVYSSATPVFNVSYALIMPHYRAMANITLIDALSDRKVGEATVWPYMIMQREADQKIERRKNDTLSRLLLRDSAGKEVGRLTATVSFEENLEHLMWSPTPAKVKRSPDEEVSLERLNIHIARFTAVMDLFNTCFTEYMHIMSWTDPVLTSSLFILFLFCTLRVNAEYQLSGVVFGCLLLMTRTLQRRRSGTYHQLCISRVHKEKEIPYRPVAQLKISVLGFRHASMSMIRRPVVRLSYVPMAELGAPTKDRVEHIIGFLGSQGVGCVDKGGLFMSSFLKLETKKADHLLHNVVDIWPLPTGLDTGPCMAVPQREVCLLYPLLQPPLTAVGHVAEESASQHAAGDVDLKVYLPWDANEGYIKAVLAHDPSSSLLEADKEYAIIPLRSIASKSGHAVQETVRWVRCADSLAAALDTEATSVPSKHTEILFRIGLFPADARACYVPNEAEKLRSAMLQDALAERDGKDASTFSVIWNMRDYIKYVQNWMAWILDVVESLKNIFNWTLPAKTYPVYLLLVAIWLLTVLVPGRYIVLVIGLYQFLYVILPIPEGDEYVIRWDNYMQSLPNDDDLHLIYNTERKAFSTQRAEDRRLSMQRTLLGLSLPLRWSGAVDLKYSSERGGIQPWHPAHLLVQGRRVFWYHSAADMEQGRAIAGQLILSRLASITQVSPVDVREKGDASRLLAVFGQDGAGKPLKLTLACNSAQDKETIEEQLRKTIDSMD